MNIDSIPGSAAIGATRSSTGSASAAAGSSASPPVPAAVNAPGTQTAADDLRKSVEAIRQWLPEPVKTDLKFRIDEESHRVVVSVVDQNGKVLRQIPADVAIRVAQNLQKFMGGLVDEVA